MSEEVNNIEVEELPLETKDGSSFTINQRSPNAFTHGF